MAHFHADTGAGDPRSIQAAHGVLGIPRIIKLDKGEAGRIPGHPDIAQRSVLAERAFNVNFGRAFAQITDIHLAIQFPLFVMRFPLGHGLRYQTPAVVYVIKTNAHGKRQS